MAVGSSFAHRSSLSAWRRPKALTRMLPSEKKLIDIVVWTLYTLPLLLHGSPTHQRLWLAKVLKNEFGMASKAPLSMQMPYQSTIHATLNTSTIIIPMHSLQNDWSKYQIKITFSTFCFQLRGRSAYEWRDCIGVGPKSLSHSRLHHNSLATSTFGQKFSAHGPLLPTPYWYHAFSDLTCWNGPQSWNMVKQCIALKSNGQKPTSAALIS